LILSVGVSAQKKDDKKQTDEQKKEIQVVVKIADDLAAGQPAANDLGLAWGNADFMKAQGNKQYAPFTVTLDGAKTTASTLAFYWRVISKDAAPPPAPAPDAKDAKKDDKKNPPGLPTGHQLRAGDAGSDDADSHQPVDHRAAGVYDVYVTVKEPTSTQNPPPANIAGSTVAHGADFWNNELGTSSVIVAQRIDPLPAPLTPQQQIERPYALGQIEIVPVTESKMAKKVELQTFMIVYNPRMDSSKKPDVMVEYNFCQVAAGSQPKAGEPCKPGEKFFNKTTPQALNAQTLPLQFDVAGVISQADRGVPLAF
jgi:hypothetical protein